MAGELIIIGVGPRGLGQLTLEAMGALKSCRLVLAAAHGPVLEHLCRGISVPCESVAWTGEAAGANDTKALAARVRSELAKEGRVAVAVDGNPALFSVADVLLALAPEAKVYAGVSSLDQVLVALRARFGDLAAAGVRALNLETSPPGTALRDPDSLSLIFNLGGASRRGPRVLAALAERLDAGRSWLVESTSEEDVVKETSAKTLAEDMRGFGVNVTLAVAPSRRRR